VDGLGDFQMDWLVRNVDGKGGRWMDELIGGGVYWWMG
jgi:hypothetical protein